MENSKNKSGLRRATQKELHRATSYDVARLAGVSQSAVSRCFKPGASVSKRMRDKVMSAAKELNYQPNAMARSLITRRSGLVAVLVSAQMNFYYPEVLFQLTQRFSTAGLRVLLFTIETEEDVAATLDEIWRYQADGVISASHLSIEHHKAFQDRGIPVVLFNRFFADHQANTVWCDPTDAVDEMVTHLREFGHKRIALIKGPSGSMVTQIRMDAVRKSCENQGLSVVASTRGTYRYESAAEAVPLVMKENPTAIIAANDMMAMGVLDELRASGTQRKNKELSVAGFDGINAARFASYELTTISQPIDRMAQAAVNLLAQRIEDPDLSHETRVLTGAFVRGRTTGPA